MHSASEAAESSQESIIRPQVSGIETEMVLLLSKIAEQKDFLNNILKKYNAENPEKIEKMIELNEIEEHPAYEDFLSALAYEQNIKDLKKLLDDFIRRI